MGGKFKDVSIAKPRKVVFKIKSTDNAGDLGVPGTYDNRSWFDASIFREDEAWTGKSRSNPMQAIKHCCQTWDIGGGFCQGKPEDDVDCALIHRGKDPAVLPKWLCPDQDEIIRYGYKLIKNGSKLMWLLQQNHNGSSTIAEHTVEWTHEYQEGDEEERPWTYRYIPVQYDCDDDLDSITCLVGDVNSRVLDSEVSSVFPEQRVLDELAKYPSTGNGKGFVASLRREDRIGIWARVMVSKLRFPAFVY
jgi:hypothetical protein